LYIDIGHYDDRVGKSTLPVYSTILSDSRANDMHYC